jgi:hypothetical protein
MKKFIIFIFISLFLSSCGANNSDSSSTSSPLVAELILSKNIINVGDKIKFELYVRKGKENIENLDEAYYQIGPIDSQNNPAKVNIKRDEDGSYHFEKTFDKPGEYVITYHVSLNDQFYEETKRIVVNKKGEKNNNLGHTVHKETTKDNNNPNHSHNHNNEEVTNDNVSVHFMYDANKKSLIAHVTKENQPLKDARVRFEIWNKENNKNHTYLEATENASGEYIYSLDKNYSGEYTIVIHVEKEKIHYHQEESIKI